MSFGAHHEWGKLREVVIGISPAEDFVVFHEDVATLAAAGRRPVQPRPPGPPPDRRRPPAAHRAPGRRLAELVAREGVRHRPQRRGEERTFMAPNGEGAQLFPRDGIS